MERRRIIDTGESHVSMVGDELRKRIIGQDEAIDAIQTSFEKARLRDERRPVASLMFLGPTGVGKTQTAEALAEMLSTDSTAPNLLRIDCAQYAQGHEVANLVGAPPGYVGREQPPALDKEIIEKPGSVVLFDEIEKGHPKLWNYLLQIMEGGKVQLLNSGNEVNFQNAVVIMTSNVGAREMDETLANKRIGFAAGEETVPADRVQSAAMGALRRQFAPEFINRLDNIITFNPLDDGQLSEVLGAHVERSNRRYQRLGNVALSLSDGLKSHLVETAPLRREFGARPVLRNYEQTVESKLSKLVARQLVGGYNLFADYEENEVSFYEGAPIVPEVIMLSDYISKEKGDN